ncbi:hypothetical protein D3870_01985 [Noviherbaspirillum cavernae]|uniref:Uncharacterized protein n=2 Tax=Noviherbaspirillum cavernae TaxID=2320862 RepID=A0A418X5K0_9BURK|nr:hypothetical protein D3870_01985 [Noviherbaspirillum cavernae]
MPNVPGMGAMTDSLEFVKSLWGGMGIPGTNLPAGGMSMPGMVIPTLSVEEIRKKIADLRAVESWLDLNMNMLRTTIQALEVQAATIATLQTMGEALNATVQASANAAAGVMPKPAQAPAAASARSEHKTAHKTSTSHEPSSKDEADAATLTAPLVNAAAWWNLLQDQFKQAVANAMVAETPKGNGHDHAAATEESNAKSEAAATPRKRKPAK